MIDITKTYRTRDGREVRIYAVDGGGEYYIHGAHHNYDDIWISACWTVNGFFHTGDRKDPSDLIEVREKHTRTVWINIYQHYSQGNFLAKDLADEYAESGRIACIQIELTYEEGEGL